MITGLYSAWADSIPILCITGQAPVARLHKEDFQAVDIAAIAGPVTKWPITVLEPAQVPGAFQQAFHLMRSGPARAGAGRPAVGRAADRDRLRHRHLRAAAGVPSPAATRPRPRGRWTCWPPRERPLIVAGGGVINADAADQLVELAELLDVPVVPTLMGWGAIPDDHRLMAGMAGIQTAAPVRQRDPARVRLRARHRQPVGQPAHRRPRHLPGRPHVRARRHRADPDRRVFTPGLRRGLRRQGGAAPAGHGRPAADAAVDRERLGRGVPAAQGDPAPPDRLRRRADQAAAGLPGDEPGLRQGRPATSPTSACPRSPAPSSCTSTSRAHWIDAGPGRAAGLDAAGGARGGRRRPGLDRGRTVRRLRLPVPHREPGRRRPVQHPVPARAGEQLLPGADPAGAARLRHGLRGAAVLRERQLPRARPVRGGSREGGRGFRLQGAAGARAGGAAGRVRAGAGS